MLFGTARSMCFCFCLLSFASFCSEMCHVILWAKDVAHIEQFWVCDRQSFTMHLMRLMTSWAVVCDVWYLEPQTLHPGETPIEFAERWASSENICNFAVIPYLICVHFVVSFLLSRLGKICLWVEGEHWTLTFGMLLWVSPISSQNWHVCLFSIWQGAWFDC